MLEAWATAIGAPQPRLTTPLRQVAHSCARRPWVHVCVVCLPLRSGEGQPPLPEGEPTASGSSLPPPPPI